MLLDSVYLFSKLLTFFVLFHRHQPKLIQFLYSQVLKELLMIMTVWALAGGLWSKLDRLLINLLNFIILASPIDASKFYFRKLFFKLVEYLLPSRQTIYLDFLAFLAFLAFIQILDCFKVKKTVNFLFFVEVRIEKETKIHRNYSIVLWFQDINWEVLSCCDYFFIFPGIILAFLSFTNPNRISNHPICCCL